MSQILEVLFTTTLNSDSASCHAHDLRTGTDLMKYKGGGSVQSHALDLIQSNYVIAANSMKPLLHVWPINGQDQISTIRFVVPGKVNAMALTPDGAYLVAGIQESMYIWHMNTGRMLNRLSKHYQPITCLRFTDNGELFVSAGKDGAVLVWNLTRTSSALDAADEEANTPMYSFNDHGLAVTDVHIGVGSQHAYLYTVSLDRCCKIYDICSGTLLLNVVFPDALHSVIANVLETSVYVGTSEGQILEFNLTATPRMKEYHAEPEIPKFIGHKEGLPIRCLALSLNGQQLISGGEDKQVCIWHAYSRQLIKCIAQSGSVTNIRVRLMNPAIFQPEHKQPRIFADSLKRMMTPHTLDDEEFITLLISEDYNEEVDDSDDVDEHYCQHNNTKDCGEDYDLKISEDEEDVGAGTANKKKGKCKKGDLLEAAVRDDVDGDETDDQHDDEENEENSNEDEDVRVEVIEQDKKNEYVDDEHEDEKKNIESDCAYDAVKSVKGNSNSVETSRKTHKQIGKNYIPSSSKPATDACKFTASEIEKLVRENKELKMRTQRLFEAFFQYMSDDVKNGEPDAKRMRKGV